MLYRTRRVFDRLLERAGRASDSKYSYDQTLYSGSCPLCGGAGFSQKDVLWDSLIDRWLLSKQEVAYINRQQGYRCDGCGARLRSMGLAAWLLGYLNWSGPLDRAVVEQGAKSNVKILEVNEAGQLHSHLIKLPGHRFGAYPEVDMEKMPFANEEFDIILHSDTLEHVGDYMQALMECCRVLRYGGVCAFTVPCVVDRDTRTTKTSLKTYHGHAYERSDDFLVRTEFGKDIWKAIVNAGFAECRISCFEYPAALVFVGVK